MHWERLAHIRSLAVSEVLLLSPIRSFVFTINVVLDLVMDSFARHTIAVKDEQVDSRTDDFYFSFVVHHVDNPRAKAAQAWEL